MMNVNVVMYLFKVFVLFMCVCWDLCGYCAFVDYESSAVGKRVYMMFEEIVDVV